jgi:predicted Zn-dependent peptidase
MIHNIIGIFDDTNFNDMTGGAKTTQNHNKIKKTKLHMFKMSKNLNESVNTNSDLNLCTTETETETETKTEPNSELNKSSYSIDADKLMPTLLIPLPNANTVTVGIFIKAGSRHETEAYGIAHFLEHMTFKGTQKRTSEQLMLDLDSIGANYNAMTGHEFTLYYISGDPRDILTLLDIVIDLYLNPTYPDTDIKKEINVVLEELRMNEDNNHRQLSIKLFKNLFEGVDQTLARPIIGFKETILKMNRSNIMSYRQKNYMGSNCLLCVSGNFANDEVIPFIEKQFQAKLINQKYSPNLFHNNIIDEPKVTHILTLQPSINRHIHLKKNINQTIINFVFFSYNSYNKNNYAVDLLCDILSNGFSSRLFNLLRNKMGVSYYNNSHNRTFTDKGQFIISVGVDHTSVLKTIQGILNELKLIVKNGITDAELSKSKKQNETSLLFQFKDPYEYLMYYGMNLLTKHPLYNLTDMLNNIESVTMNDIQTIIKQILNRNNLIIGTIGNVSEDVSSQIVQMINNF